MAGAALAKIAVLLVAAPSGIGSGAGLGAGAVGIEAVGGALPAHFQCPPTDGQIGTCVEECSSHEDCQSDGKMCCSNGCGHVCTEPIDTSKPQKTKPRKCVIMAVLAKDADAE